MTLFRVSFRRPVDAPSLPALSAFTSWRAYRLPDYWFGTAAAAVVLWLALVV